MSVDAKMNNGPKSLEAKMLLLWCYVMPVGGQHCCKCWSQRPQDVCGDDNSLAQQTQNAINMIDFSIDFTHVYGQHLQQCCPRTWNRRDLVLSKSDFTEGSIRASTRSWSVVDLSCTSIKIPSQMIGLSCGHPPSGRVVSRSSSSLLCSVCTWCLRRIWLLMDIP